MAVSNPGCIHTAKEKGARTVLWTRSQIAQTFTHTAQQSAPHLPVCYYLELEARGAAQHVRMMWRLCCSPLMWYFLPRGHSSMPQRNGTVWCDCLGWKEPNTAMSWLPLGNGCWRGQCSQPRLCTLYREKLAEATPAPEVTGSRGDRQFSSRACLLVLFLLPQ